MEAAEDKGELGARGGLEGGKVLEDEDGCRGGRKGVKGWQRGGGSKLKG